MSQSDQPQPVTDAHTPAPSATPFLMFQGGVCQQAVEFYLEVIGPVLPGSEIIRMDFFGTEGPGPEGTVAMAEFTLGRQRVLASDSFVRHEFDFTPSTSFFLELADPMEVDQLAGQLADGGQELMAPDDHGFSQRFAWVADRWGVSWQLNAQ